MIDNCLREKYKDMKLTGKLARKISKYVAVATIGRWTGNAEVAHGQEFFFRRSSAAATVNMVERTKQKARSYQFVFRNTNIALPNVGILLWIKKMRSAKRGTLTCQEKHKIDK